MLRAGRVVALLQRSSKSLEEVTLAVQVHESAFFFYYSEKFHGAGTEPPRCRRAASVLLLLWCLLCTATPLHTLPGSITSIILRLHNT